MDTRTREAVGSRQHSLADVVLELPLTPMQVRHRDVLQLLLHKAQPLLLHCREKRGWAGTCPPGSIAPDSPHSSLAAPWWSSAGRALHEHRPQEGAQPPSFPDSEILAGPLPRSSPLEVIRILQPGGLCEAVTSEGRRRRRRQLPAAISHLEAESRVSTD